MLVETECRSTVVHAEGTSPTCSSRFNVDHCIPCPRHTSQHGLPFQRIDLPQLENPGSVPEENLTIARAGTGGDELQWLIE